MSSGTTPGEPASAGVSTAQVATTGLSYRGFSSELERLAAEWVKKSLTTDAWKPNGSRFGGESQTIGVTNGTRNDVAKPGRQLHGGNKGICYAAHEKIVSDLAYHLCLPVPPVVLWDRADATVSEHRWCSISGWAFPGARKLAEVVTVPDQHRGRAGLALSAMVAFDTWVGVEDRNDGNLLVDADYKSAQPVACVDYAWSLSKNWTKGNYPRVVVDAYTARFGGLSVLDQREMANRIHDLEKAKIEATLTGIPHEFLSEEKMEIILKGLLDGQDNIHRLLGL